MKDLFFHGQKPAVHGQNGIEVIFEVCCTHNSNVHIDLNGGYLMRHFYFRFIFGVVWLGAAVVSVMKANISFTALYVLLGIVFLWSACSIWKKEKSKRDRG